KTRMENLARDDRVFIRPSPSRGSLGGASRTTREAIRLCEAAGFDTVIVETVGVGQSEVAVADMVDVFLLLQLANAGDELQGIKRGVLELADVVAITKADGAFKSAAERSRLDHERALQLVRGTKGWQPPVVVCSSHENVGIDDVDTRIFEFIDYSKRSKLFSE